MTALRGWLTQIGLEQHAALFEANDIDLEVVAHLTDADLAGLGLSLGHRRKILAAAAALAAPAPAAVPTRAAGAPASQADRRQVTVLFADLVGSTALSASLDPEEFSHLLRQFQNLCSERIAANEGYVAKLMGDGILAYFGYPVASETAAECAVRAGIDLARVVPGIEAARARAAGPLRVRVGIATGVVVVGELIGTESAQERTIVGDTPNMAARLQALAAPGEVLASETTKHLTGRLFDAEFKGVHDLKGFADPVPVWRMVRELEVESRFAAVRGQPERDDVAPILGRELERDLLLRAWEAGCASRGHVVMLCGEPGMGKSRLLEAAAANASGMPHRLLRCQCSPYRRTTPLFPIAQLVRRLADVRPERDAAANLGAIAQLLEASGLDSRHARLLLAELLDVPTGDQIAAMEMTKAQKKTELLTLLMRLVEGTAGGPPVLLLVEDAHWIDPTTQQLLAMLVDDIAARPLLAVVTHRPEYVPPWRDLPQATTLACKRLATDDCRSLVRGLAARFAIGPAVMDEIIRRSDGVPLYIEELTKAVIESRSEQTSAVPPTLRDSLMARLDRLGKVKEAALVASVLGRQFAVDLLAEVMQAGAADLSTMLQRLCESGLAFAVNADEEAAQAYCFSHSLLQEAAYESLLKSRRQALHARLADILAGRHADPELIAFHRGRAGQPVEAARAWLRASDLALARAAHPEAVGCLQHALDEADHIEDATERDRARLDAQLRRGTANIIQNGPLSPDAETALKEAHELATRLALARPLFQANWGLYLNAATSRRFDAASRHAEAISTIARELDDPELAVEGLHHRWGIAYFRGELDPMMDNAGEATRLYRRELHHQQANVFAGHDAGVCAYYCVACGLNLKGRVREAVTVMDRANGLADTLEHPMTIQFALGSATTWRFVAGALDDAAALSVRHHAFATRYAMAMALPSAMFFQAATALGHGDSAAFATLEANLAGALRYGFNGLYPHAIYAQALVTLGRAAQAHEYLQGVLESTRDPEVGMFIPELWRLRGVAAGRLGRDHAPAAVSFLETALRIATHQRADLLRLRAATDLARQRADEGDRPGARATLAGVLGSLDAACDVPERAAAERLAAELG